MVDSPSAELTLDEHGVRKLLAQGAPHFAQLPLRLVHEGWDNATWRLGEDLAVRIPRRTLAAPLIEHEQQALPVLGPRLAALGVRTPTPVVCGQATQDFPWSWSIVPWIPGRHALGRRRADNSVWASDLARALQVLHQPAPTDAPVNPVRGIPLLERDVRMHGFLAQLPTPTAHPLAQIWATGLAAPKYEGRVWIHGDLHSGNIVIDEDRLSALIDFGDVTAGDPAYDLAVAWMVFDADGRAAFRRATMDHYDDATWIRARAWSASVAAILLTQSDDRDEYRLLGQSTATELISEDATAPPGL